MQSTSVLTDFWFIGTDLKSQGGLHCVVLPKFSECGDKLTRIHFHRHRRMEDALVLLCRQGSRVAGVEGA
jgi:hypothetical protein